MQKQTLLKVFSEYDENELMPGVIFDRLFKDVEMAPPDDDETFYDPLYGAFDNYDVRHQESIHKPIYLNDFDFKIQQDRQEIISLLRTEYDQNNFSTIGSCHCGKYRKNIYVGTKFVCDDCGTPVVKPLSSDFKTRVWLRTPAKVAGFLNPSIYDTLIKRLSTRTPKVSIAEYWMDKRIRQKKIYTQPGESGYRNAQKLEEFRKSLGIDYGYNAFVNNLDQIVTELLNNDYLRILDLKPAKREEYAAFWEKYKSCAVSKVFPVPNKIMTIVESDNRNKYYTREQIELNQQFQTIADFYKDWEPRSTENEELMGQRWKGFIGAIAKVRNHLLFGKKSAIRFSAPGGKLPFGGRTIISGECGVGRSDTVVLPWLFVLTCLHKHLLSWLYRRGYTPVKAAELIRNAAERICPIILEFVEWVEKERLGMAMVGRMPSIQYLSARAFFIRFNRDPTDLSMRIPILSTKSYGADFDGDAMWCRIIFDLFGKRAAYGAWGHQQSMDPNYLFRTGPFCFQTKTNLLSVNSVVMNTPVVKR